MNTYRDSRRVVVGVDNTPAGTSALLWAAKRASRRHAELDVIHVHDSCERPDKALEKVPTEELREVRGRLFVRVADRLASGIRPGPDVVVSVQSGPLVATLANAGQGAEVLVLGEPTAPEHEDLAEQVSALCECAVAVVGEGGRARFVSGERPVQTRRSQGRPESPQGVCNTTPSKRR